MPHTETKQEPSHEGQPENSSETVLAEHASALNTTTLRLIEERHTVPEHLAGARVDQVAALVFPAFSREKLKQWLGNGSLTLNGASPKASSRVVGGETLQLRAHETVVCHDRAQAIDLSIVHVDEDVIVINKPAGMVVHPGTGNPDGTLVNALLFHFPELEALPRAGLVHRIDKDTSGLLVVARNLESQLSLTQQLQEKSVYRIYDAVVQGEVIAGGTVDAPIMRHPHQRTAMCVRNDGRPSVTHYHVAERFGPFTLLTLQLETGRTHQIRVHMTHKGWPLLGDPVYGRGFRRPKGATAEFSERLKSFGRQALHARELGFVHPSTGEECLFEAPWPEDFSSLVDSLRQYVADQQAAHEALMNRFRTPAAGVERP